MATWARPSQWLGLSSHEEKGLTAAPLFPSGQLRRIVWISDPYIWTVDPIAKATHASGRQKKHSHLLAVAREVIAAHGVDASMRIGERMLRAMIGLSNVALAARR